ncbi:hypothetical protein SLEP1_g38814 [Rubroshorea leprosula]|uniref:MULE transposase domain-containing protein n=1 Tax=Rubroshorea leprosula TaxID=152421 RepID=A0AAV5KY89_9ROSI|nr:hypothetical protein SLEP1_g38814 [Rubroshorea leprosula]
MILPSQVSLQQYLENLLNNRPPIEYKATQCTSLPFDYDSVITLKCLAGDDGIRDILCIVRADVEEEGRHEEKVGEGIDNEVSGGADEGDLGNITQEYPIGSNSNTGNTVEKGECSEGNIGNCGELEFGSIDGYVDDWSSTDDEVYPFCNSDRDDEVLIDVKKRARSIRRPTEGLEVPSGLQTPQGVKYKHVAKKPTPRSTPIKQPATRFTSIKKPATRSALVSRGIPVENDMSKSDNDGKDNQYEHSDDAGKLRDSFTESEEENLFFVSTDAARQRRTSNVYFNPSWDVPFFEVENKMMTTVMVAEYFKSRIYATPFLKCKDMMIFAYNKLRVNINYKKCVRAKKMVLKEMEGSFKDEYAIIHALGGHLKEVNLGNSIFIKIEENDASERMFMKTYVCLKVIKDGWKNGCRGIFGVDVEPKNNDSWTWFMQRIASNLELGSGHGCIMISDKCPGIICAKAEVLPLLNHRYCVRHLYCNLTKRHRGDDAFWIAARALYQIEFLEKMEELRGVSKEAYAKMMDLLGRFWYKAFFDEDCKCDVVDNNMCETFNSWILAVRYMNWNYEDFVHENYKKEKYLQAYGIALKYLKGNEVLKRRPKRGCLPPVLRTLPGRPRRNRRKDKHEPKKVKVGGVIINEGKNDSRKKSKQSSVKGKEKA